MQGTTSQKDDHEGEMENMTALLTAAKNGVKEIVKKILDAVPTAINGSTTKNKNILVLAVENRQPYILDMLRDFDEWDSLIHVVDNEGNNVLHLAAKASTYEPWQIPGSALQMQWEIKWYQVYLYIYIHSFLVWKVVV